MVSMGCAVQLTVCFRVWVPCHIWALSAVLLWVVAYPFVRVAQCPVWGLMFPVYLIVSLWGVIWDVLCL